MTKTFTEIKAHKCTACGNNSSLQQVTCKDDINREFPMWRVCCTTSFFECGVMGPLSNSPDEAIDKWHNLIGRYLDGSTKHI